MVAISSMPIFRANGSRTNNCRTTMDSRLRRAEVGTHHHIAGKYLGAYAAEMAWREDNNRQANGTQFKIAIGAVAAAPVSRQWAGYKPISERFQYCLQNAKDIRIVVADHQGRSYDKMFRTHHSTLTQGQSTGRIALATESMLLASKRKCERRLRIE
jgi:hypothetical protein